MIKPYRKIISTKINEKLRENGEEELHRELKVEFNYNWSQYTELKTIVDPTNDILHVDNGLRDTSIFFSRYSTLIDIPARPIFVPKLEELKDYIILFLVLEIVLTEFIIVTPTTITFYEVRHNGLWEKWHNAIVNQCPHLRRIY